MSTPSAPPKNLYHLRRVADASAKPCFVCYRQSTSVLITPDHSDFFYTCAGHLQDSGFCTPVVDEPEDAEKRRKEELQKEVERVKSEWDERQKKKKQTESDKKEDKNKKEDKDKDKDKEGEKEKEKEKEGEKDAAATAARVFTLHKKIYDMRVARLRQIAQAKRNQQLMKSPGFWPSVPKGGV
ncbi:VPS4-associated protein 1 [Sphaerosporella brunnea]|uniref:VPS4-associated protein 1 n=1 Tax=Sphaerosporella brunnea TaxID=1250544 RepID=A0A5J5ED91_9PEZI|nr:VPS4-associated protein 1 [Sphaerosporella brunnea]